MLSQTLAFTHLVGDHMSPAPVRVTDQDSCGSVLSRIKEQQASSAIVENASANPVGIVTEQDVARRMTFSVEPSASVQAIMTSPVATVAVGEYLYSAIARMRRHSLRHMPVVDTDNHVVGILELHKALAVAGRQIVDHIERLSHDETIEGFQKTRASQGQVAAELFADAVPAPEVQAMLTRINNDLHTRVCRQCVDDMSTEGHGPPPVPFDVIVMGSGGRGESYLTPDQDNGFILEDYPDSEHTRIDQWFITLAERVTRKLNDIGFPYCKGFVMATNPLWRKTLPQWQHQIDRWMNRSAGQGLRMSEIFFDFTCVYGNGTLAAQLRDHITAKADKHFFLAEIFRLDEAHEVALGFCRRLRTNREAGPNHGRVNLKLGGTLPLVSAARLLALREQIPATSTLARISELGKRSILNRQQEDDLSTAYEHITRLLLRQQLTDLVQGRPPGNHVLPETLSRRERSQLIDSLRAIRSFRNELRLELTGNAF